MNTVIRVENLSKKYIIGHQQQESYTALRDVISSKARDLFKRVFNPMSFELPASNSSTEEFWALKEVSFEIKQGDRVGIIGRNGAGKSTLLKILSRITEPTDGRIAIKGKVASLLEVGTGFHPELTGRENIFLNGAVLGMSKRDIKTRFDEIVAFAEVEKFLDTPVKHYSSGMYVRLAFAVAAHLEPEILIIDEILAVGDAQFQKKCLGKMEEVGKGGRTILFVSHNMGMVSHLCSKAFLLNKGNIVKYGTPDETVSFYMQRLSTDGNDFFSRPNGKKMNQEMYISEVKTANGDGIETSNFNHKDTIVVGIKGVLKKYLKDVSLGIAVKDRYGRRIFTSQVALDSYDLKKKDNGFIAVVRIPGGFLVPGQYSFYVGLHIPNLLTIDHLEDICKFTIADVGSEFALYEGLDYGCVFANCVWDVKSESNR